MITREILLQNRQFRLSLLSRNSWSQIAQQLDLVIPRLIQPIPTGEDLRLHRQKAPHVDYYGRVPCSYESPRRHANDGGSGFVDLDDFPNHRRIATETLLPKRITENHDWIGPWRSAFDWVKQASQNWRDTQL